MVSLPPADGASYAGKWSGRLTDRKVLVVDDDEGVRAVTGEMLKRIGCDPTLVDSGEAAVAACQVKDYDVVLLDFTMPDMSGEDVYRTLRAADSDLRVIFMSGVDRPRFDALGPYDARTAFLAKPFPMAELERSMRDMIG